MRHQISLFTHTQLGLSVRSEYGGSLAPGRRKMARPIATRRPMHLVLCSTRAKGPWSLRRRDTDARIRSAMRALAQRSGIRVYQFANAGTHLHLLVRTKRRDQLQTFLRAFAGITARLATGARKGRPAGRFWDLIAYSRILHWGREFIAVRAYLIRNELEACGLIPYRARARRSRGPRSPPSIE
jgi:REP element-mobilizing transposase RayT